jgi:acyl-coenzyme A synthetase/AMP-(fatty) acid ligase
MESYGFPGTPLRDPDRTLERYAEATIAPEAAVFDAAGQLRYHGRIDDRWVAFGKSRQEASRHDLEIAISEVLEGRAVSVAETRAIGCYLTDLR